MAISLQVGDIVKVREKKMYPKEFVGFIGFIIELRQLEETVAVIKDLKALEKQAISSFVFNFEDLEIVGHINLSCVSFPRYKSV